MLVVKNLEVVYHSVMLVLRGVSLTVPDGGIVALLGPNGAGKTTLIRAITGLLSIHEGKVTKGSIALKEADITRALPAEIVQQGVAQVMEGRRIFADLSVEENLLAGAYTRREGVRQELDAFYTQFPVLGERRKRQAGYLSGGEQQMLAIARALISRPRLLLLDEPSLGLAPKIVADIAALIRDVNQRGVAVLLVEQNAAMALDVADYGYVIENGKIVTDGSADDLRADEDIQEFYLGLGHGERKSFREVKHYRRRKRWLS